MSRVSKQFSSIVTASRASARTVTNSAGTLVSRASGEWALDYDPATLAVRGIPVEEQRTNLLLRNQQLDDAAWIRSGLSSVTANAVAAPDGTTTAEKLIEDAGVGVGHFVYQTATIVSGTTYTQSIFAKAGERTQVAMLMGVGGP